MEPVAPIYDLDDQDSLGYITDSELSNSFDDSDLVNTYQVLYWLVLSLV